MQGAVTIGHCSEYVLTIDEEYGGTFSYSFSDEILTVTNTQGTTIRGTLIKTLPIYG